MIHQVYFGEFNMDFISHLLPILITLAAFLILYFFFVGKPYIEYTALVDAAGTEEGEIKLAKHLAAKAGGKKTDTVGTWESFLPAAKALHEQHQVKISDIG